MKLRGKSGSTYKVSSTDTAVAMAAGVLTDATMGEIDSVTITVETNSIRIAIGTPTQAGLGHLLAAGDSIEIKGSSDCNNLKWISAAAGVHGSLQITPRYDFGG